MVVTVSPMLNFLMLPHRNIMSHMLNLMVLPHWNIMFFYFFLNTLEQGEFVKDRPLDRAILLKNRPLQFCLKQTLESCTGVQLDLLHILVGVCCPLPENHTHQ